MILKDLTGQTFGRWKVVKRIIKKSRARRTFWLCRCECGTEKPVEAHSLKIGDSTSCGCYHREVFGRMKRRHGHTVQNGRASSEYQAWRHAKNRCFNPKDKRYSLYGGRGITMIPEWIDSFDTFLKDMGKRPPNTTLDRNDTNGNYEPGNCRWATQREQQRNRNNNHLLTINGRTLCVAEWADISPVSYSRIHARLVAGWPPFEAVFTPPLRNGDRLIKRRD